MGFGMVWDWYGLEAVTLFSLLLFYVHWFGHMCDRDSMDHRRYARAISAQLAITRVDWKQTRNAMRFVTIQPRDT